MEYSNYEALKKYVFVFVGQNATTGEPNKKTGRLSNYGQFYCFDNAAAAKEFADNQNGINDQIIEIGSARALRKYALGSSVVNYIEHLHFVNSNFEC